MSLSAIKASRPTRSPLVPPVSATPCRPKLRLISDSTEQMLCSCGPSVFFTIRDEKERAKILTNEILSAKGRIDLLTESYIEKRKMRRQEDEDEYEDFIDRIEGKFDIGLRRELRRWLEHEGFFMFSEVERRRDNADADSSSEFKDSP